MTLLLIHMGVLRNKNEAMNDKGTRCANVDKAFERVFVLEPPHPDTKSKRLSLDSEVYIYTFYYHRVLSYLNFVKLIVKGIALHKKYKIDLIHAYNPYMCGLVGVILKKIFKLPLTISVHSDLNTLFSPNLKKYLFRSKLLTKRIEALCLRSANQIWVQAEHQKQYIQKSYAIDDGNFRKIKILFDRKEFPISKPRSFSSGIKKKIVFVGRLDAQKNVLSLLQAYKKIKAHGRDVEVVIIGEGSQMSLLENYKVENRLDGIIFLGAMDNLKIRPYLLQADCFVHPGGLGEGLSNTLVEAQMCGSPVVVSDVYPEREFVTDDNALRYNYNNSSDLAEKIESLLDDSKRMEYLSRMSIQTAQRYFQECPFALKKKLYQDLHREFLSK